MASFVLPIISGLAGFLGGGKQQQQTQTGVSSQNAAGQSFTGATSTPNLSPFQQALAGLFTQGASSLYNTSANLSPYTTAGLTAIQGQGGGNAQTIANNIAQRGLAYSPAALNPITQNVLNTGNQANQFLSSVPLLQRQLQQQGLSGLLSAFSALPTGQTTAGTSSTFGNQSGTSSGTGTTYGNPLASGLSFLGQALGGPAPGYTSNIGQILEALGIG